VGFSEWARRLDDRVVVPADRKINPPWMRTPLARWGMSAAIIFGGGFVLRVVFRHEVATSDWALVTYAVVGIVGLSMLLTARHRSKTRERE
jgi:hypothetical protein